MKRALRKNWVPKIVSLLLATAIWFLIRQHLRDSGELIEPDDTPALRAIPVKEEDAQQP